MADLQDPFPAPLAFISYAWTSERHKDRVRRLADRLRVDGVNVLLDQYHLRPGDNVTQYMERIAADPSLRKVIAVCDQNYQRKVNLRQGGSGTEGTIISQGVYEQIGDGSGKYVAIVFDLDEEGRAPIPAMLASSKYIEMHTDDLLEGNYEELLRFLHDRPVATPALGKVPQFLLAPSPEDAVLYARSRAVEQALDRQRSVLTPWEEFLEVLIASLGRFRNPYTPREDAEIMLADLEGFLPARNALIALVRLLVREQKLTAEMLMPLINSLGNHLERVPNDWGVEREATGHVRAAVIELMLFLMTVLVQERQIDLLTRLLNAPYIVRAFGEERILDFGLIRGNSQWFEEAYARAKNTTRQAAFLHFLNQRTTSRIDLTDLMQTDALLSINSFQNYRSRADQFPAPKVWWPVLEDQWDRCVFPLFLQLSSQTELRHWLPMFRVSTIQEFVQQHSLIFSSPSNERRLGGMGAERIFSISKLGSRL